MNKNVIGIMDSGVGGLTVEKEIAKVFPGNDIIYIGDTARVPYGGRSPETIKDFSLELLKYLLSKKVSVIVVACNTISATCLSYLQEKSTVPVIGVIEPTISEVLRSQVKKVGIIGTRATIKSNIYANKLQNLITVSIACPLFVPLVEEKCTNVKAIQLIVEDYLKPMKGKIDGLILGCTHYPYLRKYIEDYLGPIYYFESGRSTAEFLKSIINKDTGTRKIERIFTDEVKR